MAVYRFSQKEVNEYREHMGINQSLLKILIGEGIQAFKDKFLEFQAQDDLYYEEKKHFIIGSAIDCYFTQGEEVFNECYFISKVQKPPEKPMSVIRMVFDKLIVNKEPYHIEEGSGFLGTTPNEIVPAEMRELGFFKKELYEAADAHGYYMNRRIPTLNGQRKEKGKWIEDTRTWQDDKRIEGMLNDNGVCNNYWEELKKSVGKQILSDEESEIINAIIMSFKTHPFTRDLHVYDNPKKDYIFQLPLYFTLLGLDCKALLDRFEVDHEFETVTPQDYKTLSDYILRFGKHVKMRRYDIQGGYYTLAVKKCLEYISSIIGKDITHYTIMPFEFIAESTIRPGVPLVFTLSNELLHQGMEGGIDKYGDPIKGVRQALAEYRFWSDLEYSITDNYMPNNGRIVINERYELI